MITEEQAQSLYDAIIAVAEAHADYATADYYSVDDAGSRKREAETDLWDVLQRMTS